MAQSKYRPPKDLLIIDPTADHKLVIQKFDTLEMKRYRAFMQQLRDSTGDEMSDIEYSYWSLIMMWLDRFDEWAKDRAIDKVPTPIRDQERKYRVEMLKMLERYRDKGPRSKSFLEQCQEFLVEIEGTEGDLKIEWRKKDIIDGDAQEISTETEAKKEKVETRKALKTHD